MTEYAYRFEDRRISNGVDEFGDPHSGSRLGIQVQSYPILSRTPKGIWINIWSGKRFVLLTANKRFAVPDKQGAWADFQHRKKRQARIYEGRLKHAREAIVASELPLADAIKTFNMNGGMFQL